MSSLLLESRLPDASGERDTDSTLIVAWQNSETREISPVGLLEHDHGGYRFRYIRNARNVKNFLPFLGFTDLTSDYRSRWLFPMFAQRVLNPRRPDYTHWRNVLNLPADATPFEFLARCEGRREGDAVLVTAPPRVGDHGEISFTFLVHGVRHVVPQDRALDALNRLSDGDEVELRPQPDNSVDRLAIHVCSGADPIGWVPRLLCPAVHDALTEGQVIGRVLRINGPEVPAHMRLLVELNGSVPPGWDFFADPIWSPIAD
jgi:hypothetical protein